MECVNKILIGRKPPLPPIKVPCGQCIACRLNRASDWAFRIMCEKKMTSESCFLTLTYNDENVPRVIGQDGKEYATLVKRDVQLFLKRLRKEIAPKKIRYYLCGEYGETYGRPHFHIIIFGLGQVMVWELASRLWSFGFVHVGDVSVNSASYVARYCTKLLTGKAKFWYAERNILPEFSLMSRRPGIGASWLEKYGNEVKVHHNVVVKGKYMSPPRYFRDKVYDEVDRSVVCNSVVDKIAAQIKEGLVYEKTHDGSYEFDVAQAREANIKSRMALKKKRKL